MDKQYAESTERRVRLYVQFEDPDSDVVIRADATWLTSRWRCIFGAGCPGIDATRPQAGCCALGAHFTDEDDIERVSRSAERLTPEIWQHEDSGRDGAWLTSADDGEPATASMPSGCVFLNSPDFPGGAGCALHVLALREGTDPMRFKPDVCWQLPIRRSYRTVTLPDSEQYLELTLDEYDRRAWGPGGADLDWFCTASPAALTAGEPLYRTMAAELTELIGAAAYSVLAKQCAAIASIASDSGTR